MLAEQDTYRDPQTLTELIQRWQIDVVQATPSMWSLLLKTTPDISSPLKLAIATGETLSTGTKNIFPHTMSLEPLWTH